MPRSIDTFLEALYSEPGRKNFAGPPTDIPAQYAVMAALKERGEAPVTDVQREVGLPLMRFTQAIQGLVANNLVSLMETEEGERVSLTGVGSALMAQQT